MAWSIGTCTAWALSTCPSQLRNRVRSLRLCGSCAPSWSPCAVKNARRQCPAPSRASPPSPKSPTPSEKA
eukprot:scaffold3418_cov124-Isochrysis_galbana.AAC.21